MSRLESRLQAAQCEEGLDARKPSRRVARAALTLGGVPFELAEKVEDRLKAGLQTYAVHTLRVDLEAGRLPAARGLELALTGWIRGRPDGLGVESQISTNRAG